MDHHPWTYNPWSYDLRTALPMSQAHQPWLYDQRLKAKHRNELADCKLYIQRYNPTTYQLMTKYAYMCARYPYRIQHFIETNCISLQADLTFMLEPE